MEKLVEIMLNEGLDEDTIVNVISSLFEQEKPKDPEGYEENIKKANEWDHKYSLARANDPNAKMYNDMYQKYFNKAMQCFYGTKEDGKSPINCSLSESCFNDIISLVEELIYETKKANKLAHQEAIFRKREPHGAFVYVNNHVENPHSKEVKKGMTNQSKDHFGNTQGIVHSLSDYRKAKNTDSKNSAPSYNPETGFNDVRSFSAEDIRDLLGRDSIFNNSEPKQSKSNELLKQYKEGKTQIENVKKEAQQQIQNKRKNKQNN